MAIDEEALKRRVFPDVCHAYARRDTMLYALGVGLGQDPMDARDLRYVYEDDLIALPTMATTMGSPGFWMAGADSGLNWRRIVHAEQSLTIHRPLPVEGTLIGRNSVEDVFDRGEGRGALLRIRRDLLTEAGALQSTQVMTVIARDDGGFGGRPPPRETGDPWPERSADAVVEHRVSARAALIYRLSGDYNPLHASPDAARLAGFARPILHGLCTYALAGWAVVQAFAGGDAARLSELSVRFTAPVFPGETLRTELWRAGQYFLFRSAVVERDVLVLDRGRAVVLP